MRRAVAGARWLVSQIEEWRLNLTDPEVPSAVRRALIEMIDLLAATANRVRPSTPPLLYLLGGLHSAATIYLAPNAPLAFMLRDAADERIAARVISGLAAEYPEMAKKFDVDELAHAARLWAKMKGGGRAADESKWAAVVELAHKMGIEATAEGVQRLVKQKGALVGIAKRRT